MFEKTFKSLLIIIFKHFLGVFCDKILHSFRNFYSLKMFSNNQGNVIVIY